MTPMSVMFFDVLSSVYGARIFQLKSRSKADRISRGSAGAGSISGTSKKLDRYTGAWTGALLPFLP